MFSNPPAKLSPSPHLPSTSQGRPGPTLDNQVDKFWEVHQRNFFVQFPHIFLEVSRIASSAILGSHHRSPSTSKILVHTTYTKEKKFNFQYFIEHLKFKRMGLKALKLIESLLPRKLTECTSNYEYQSSRSHKNWSGSTHGRSYSVPSSPLLWQRSSHMAVLLEAMLCIDRDKEHGGT